MLFGVADMTFKKVSLLFVAVLLMYYALSELYYRLGIPYQYQHSHTSYFCGMVIKDEYARHTTRLIRSQTRTIHIYFPDKVTDPKILRILYDARYHTNIAKARLPFKQKVCVRYFKTHFGFFGEYYAKSFEVSSEVYDLPLFFVIEPSS